MNKDLVAQFDELAENTNINEFDANNLSETEIMAGKAIDITINIICRPKEKQQ